MRSSLPALPTVQLSHVVTSLETGDVLGPQNALCLFFLVVCLTRAVLTHCNHTSLCKLTSFTFREEAEHSLGFCDGRLSAGKSSGVGSFLSTQTWNGVWSCCWSSNFSTPFKALCYPGFERCCINKILLLSIWCCVPVKPQHTNEICRYCVESKRCMHTFPSQNIKL